MNAPARGRRLGGEPKGEPGPCDGAADVSAAEPGEQTKRKLHAAHGRARPLKSRVGKLSEVVAEDLRSRLEEGEWNPSERLPGEPSTGQEIGWGDQPGGTLYLLLEQTHFDARSRAVAYSRTWFIEGRFQFNLVRVR